MGPDELSRRLAELAADAPGGPVPDRREAVRRRVRTVRRRRAGAGVVSAAAVVALAVPLLPAPAPSVDRLVTATPAAPAPVRERVVATFAFPTQSAVAELVVPDGAVAAGTEHEVVVRVSTERGRVGGVDLSWGDNEFKYLDGQPRCTPDAGPTVVELRARHVWRTPGRVLVRAAPQVITGCDEGAGRFSVDGTTAATAAVEVVPAASS